PGVYLARACVVCAAAGMSLATGMGTRPSGRMRARPDMLSWLKTRTEIMSPGARRYSSATFVGVSGNASAQTYSPRPAQPSVAVAVASRPKEARLLHGCGAIRAKLDMEQYPAAVRKARIINLPTQSGIVTQPLPARLIVHAHFTISVLYYLIR